MKKLGFVLAAAAALSTSALAAAGTAAAVPTGGGNAADTVRQLQAEGYSVQLNGTASVPLSRCTTTGVHGIPDSVNSAGPQANPLPSDTVYVDISCPDNI